MLESQQRGTLVQLTRARRTLARNSLGLILVSTTNDSWVFGQFISTLSFVSCKMGKVTVCTCLREQNLERSICCVCGGDDDECCHSITTEKVIF